MSKVNPLILSDIETISDDETISEDESPSLLVDDQVFLLSLFFDFLISLNKVYLITFLKLNLG
jgi:hypothetical protein